uniref:EGF-like domain-containing protein n=1 Tax=Strongyloides papillosus TaxID=174720 RepID=A0A0N5BZ65_STREA
MDLRYEFAKCSGKDQGNITARYMGDIITNYKCHFFMNSREHIDFRLRTFVVSSLPKNYSLTSNIDLSTLEQRNYATELPFLELKAFNKKIYRDGCKNHPCGTFSNNGFRSPNNYDYYTCPTFFTGGNCEKLELPRKPEECGPQTIKTEKKPKTQPIDINTDCYYNIQPYHKTKQVQVKFTPIGEAIHWPCTSGKILEVKYDKDKSKDGIMPCGKMTNFTVKGSKVSNF